MVLHASPISPIGQLALAGTLNDSMGHLTLDATLDNFCMARKGLVLNKT